MATSILDLVLQYTHERGITPDVLRAAGCKFGRHDGRPSIAIPTANGMRYRFLDGDSPRYISEPGYQRCWFGLRRAVEMGGPLVLCNGEISTIAAQHYGLPAACITSGEKRSIPPPLLDELLETGRGDVVIAADCDDAGRHAALGVAAQLSAKGISVRVLALPFGDGSGADLADWCAHCRDTGADSQDLYGLTEIEVPAPATNSQRPLRAATSPHRINDNDDDDDMAAEIKGRLDIVSLAERLYGAPPRREGKEYRVVGHGGLMLKPDEGVWYHHSADTGGDMLDLVHYAEYGTVIDGDSERFKRALGAAAGIAGVSLPEPRQRRSARRSGPNAVIPGTPQESPPPEEGPSRPALDYTDRNLPYLQDGCWRGVQTKYEGKLYRQGPLLIVIDDDAPEPVDTVDHPLLTHMVGHAVRLVESKKTKSGTTTRECYPDQTLVKTMLRVPPPSLPVVERVVRTPTVVADGDGYRIIEAPGYDAPSRVYHRRTLDMPTEMSLDEARELLLDDLLGDFPFAPAGDDITGEASRANALALLLLPFVRSLISGPTPLHLVEAARPGTGKGLLAEIMTIIWAGENPELTLAPSRDDDAEWAKSITAVLRRVPEYVVLDNVTRLGSDALSMVLTAQRWQARLLGHSRVAILRNDAAWIATANNPSIYGDMPRRIVPIRIVSPHEDPSLRTKFRHQDLRGWAYRNRARLVRACLTLATNGLTRDTESAAPRMGSYEGYCDVLGRILVACGIDGFLGNLQRARNNERTDNWRAVVEIWWRAHGRAPVSASQLWSTLRGANCPIEFRGETERAQAISLGRQVGRQEGAVYEVDGATLQIAVVGRANERRYVLRELPGTPGNSRELRGTPGESSRGDLPAPEAAPGNSPGTPGTPSRAGAPARARAHAHAREAREISPGVPGVPGFPSQSQISTRELSGNSGEFPGAPGNHEQVQAFCTAALAGTLEYLLEPGGCTIVAGPHRVTFASESAARAWISDALADAYAYKRE